MQRIFQSVHTEERTVKDDRVSMKICNTWLYKPYQEFQEFVDPTSYLVALHFKIILSRFCVCSAGSQKFNMFSGPEQSQFLRFYAAKCQTWIPSKNISFSFTHRRSEIVLLETYFIPALSFSSILLFLRLTFLKIIKFQMRLIDSRTTSWVTLRKGSQIFFS